MKSTMMATPLSLNHLVERAGQLFHGNQIVSRLADKSLRRHSYGEFYRRTRSLAAALQKLGVRKGDRVATLCWNHHAHLECYFGIRAAATPDGKWGERPLACVVLRKGADAHPGQLNEHLLKHSFAKWQLPERYEFIDAVPRTSTGKFWKLKLRQRFPHQDARPSCPGPG